MHRRYAFSRSCSREVPVTVGPGDEVAAGAGGHSHLRASHADREQVIDVLKAAFVQRRLAKDEFDLRVGQVLASRTYADLGALTADIPAGLVSAQPPTVPAPTVPTPTQGHTPVGANVRARERAIVATAMFGGLAWVIALFAGPVAALPFLAGIGSIFVSLFLLGTRLRGQRPCGRVPPQRAISTGPGSRGQAAPGGRAEQLLYGGNTRRQGQADTARGQIPRLQVAVASGACCPCH
jgi:hypothetical protein